MVKFELHEQNKNKLIYWYYPQNHCDKKHGVITVHLEKDKIEITELAEEDFAHCIYPEEINELVNAINLMKSEQGETDFAEPVSSVITITYYGDKALGRISTLINQGEIPTSGTVMWY